jgi:23S rRNA pseudouridine2605 synthase
MKPPRRAGRPGPSRATAPRHGLARALSKAGVCSRSEAARWITEGRVRVDGRRVLDPEFPVVAGAARIEVEGLDAAPPVRRYLMLNKPRGLVTTARDEQGRDTVYRCFDGAGLPWLAPVGRLDRASEGLLLFTNDPAWAARITDPDTGPDKTYHVQVDVVPDEALLAALERGVDDRGEYLRAGRVQLLRAGDKRAWLGIALDEGRNRHIRRLLEAHGVGVVRLVRVAIGELALGELPKGGWRELDATEVDALALRSTGGAALV